MATTYSGEVTPGGPAQTRELPALRITKVAVDEKMSNNCYLLQCRETGERLMIDAADDAPTLKALIGDPLGGEPLTGIVTTHQHWDHHRALAEMVRTTGARTFAGAPDADAVSEQTGVEVDVRLEHGDTVAFGHQRLQVIAVAGHTPGSVCLRYDDPDGHPHLFTGDCLFPGGVGATFGDDEKFAQLIDDVETRIFGTLPDETWFYPGHGADGRLGNERPHLAEWRARGW